MCVWEQAEMKQLLKSKKWIEMEWKWKMKNVYGTVMWEQAEMKHL